MNNITYRSAAAVRPRTLWTHELPFALSTVELRIPQGSRLPNHNSIATNAPTVNLTAVGTPVRMDRADYGAAKQAAPPRGVPR